MGPMHLFPGAPAFSPARLAKRLDRLRINNPGIEAVVARFVHFVDLDRPLSVEDNVVLYSNATVLGGQTVIGHDSIIGGNTWRTESVPPHSVIYHKAEVTLRSNKGM